MPPLNDPICSDHDDIPSKSSPPTVRQPFICVGVRQGGIVARLVRVVSQPAAGAGVGQGPLVGGELGDCDGPVIDASVGSVVGSASSDSLERPTVALPSRGGIESHDLTDRAEVLLVDDPKSHDHRIGRRQRCQRVRCSGGRLVVDDAVGGGIGFESVGYGGEASGTGTCPAAVAGNVEGDSQEPGDRNWAGGEPVSADPSGQIDIGEGIIDLVVRKPSGQVTAHLLDGVMVGLDPPSVIAHQILLTVAPMRVARASRFTLISVRIPVIRREAASGSLRRNRRTGVTSDRLRALQR